MPHRILGLIFFYHLSFFEAKAQADSTNYNYFFDDGGISTSKVLLKTDVLAMIHGDWPLILEYVVSDQIALEAGFGVLMPYYVHDFLPLIFIDNKGIVNNEVGHSIHLQLKWYHENEAPELEYWGLQYYRRVYSGITVNEMAFSFGKQRIIGKRFLFDISLGIGLRFQKSDGVQYIFDPDFSSMPILPLQIRFGYITNSNN